MARCRPFWDRAAQVIGESRVWDDSNVLGELDQSLMEPIFTVLPSITTTVFVSESILHPSLLSK